MNDIGKMGERTANSVQRQLFLAGVTAKVVYGAYNRYGVEVWLKNNERSFILTTQLEANGALKAIRVMQ